MGAKVIVRLSILEIAALAVLGLLCGGFGHARLIPQQESQPAAASSAPNKAVGKVKAVAGNVITLTTDAGTDMSVQAGEATRLLRVEPGQKDLKTAAPVQLQEIRPGDRLLVRGEVSAEGNPMVASTIVLMKAEDVSAKQERGREDWKQRGVGGLVSTVDAASETITITVSGFGETKTLKIHVTKSTIVRRYAPDSIKFDDARVATVTEVKPGDQLRARGDRSVDRSELAAQEVVFGTFRNIAGTVVSTDATRGTLTVTDLATKKPVVLTITADSQMRKLPTMIAQRVAMRLKGGATESGRPGAGASSPSGMAAPNGGAPGGEGGNGRSGGPPDFQQMLGHMPAVALNELQKGDGVMMVTTEGSANVPPKAVTLLTGVEPILTASPDSGRAAMLLSPWNLGGAGGAGDAGGGANP